MAYYGKEYTDALEAKRKFGEKLCDMPIPRIDYQALRDIIIDSLSEQKDLVHGMAYEDRKAFADFILANLAQKFS